MGRDAEGRARLAEVREDASVNLLCERVAALLGKAAATWVPTCGMGNLAAMLVFCRPGEHVVLEAASHVLTSESMGIVEVARLEAVAPVGGRRTDSTRRRSRSSSRATTPHC